MRLDCPPPPEDKLPHAAAFPCPALPCSAQLPAESVQNARHMQNLRDGGDTRMSPRLNQTN